MSHYSKLFNRIPIDVPNKSGFDESHTVSGTTRCGRLTPVLVDELLPGDTISLGHLTQMEYPPFATNFRGKVDVHLEAFFVPNRIIYGGWESFITHPTLYPLYPAGTPAQNKSKYLPGLFINAYNSNKLSVSQLNTYFGPDSLADYLGYKCHSLAGSTAPSVVIPNALPWLAYHRIYNDHYRYSKLMPELFFRPSSASGIIPTTSDKPSVTFRFTTPSVVPYCSDSGTKVWLTNTTDSSTGATLSFTDGVSLLSMRQRTWFRDYFTSSSPEPQAASQGASVIFDIVSNKGSFNIAELRAANSLQLWLERQDICGYDYASQIAGNFGHYPKSASLNRSIYLGRSIFNMYCKGVSQTTGGQGSLNTNNPFTTVGTRYGQAMSLESSSLVDSFTADEHGILMVLLSIVPHASYSSGKERYLFRDVMSDFAFPLLQGTGEQAILKRELLGVIGDESDDDKTEFGYTDLYTEYKFKQDTVHGLLRDGSSLDAFALQRGFDGSPEITDSFVIIPPNYLDQVKAVASESSGFDSWFDCYFQYKKVSTLQPYSVPTLEQPKNTHKKDLPRGGRNL